MDHRPTLRRPLTARSVVASVLLGVDPPELPTSSLVRTASLFGLAEGTVRVAMSRMVSAGELAAADGRHRLSGELLARHGRQRTSRLADTQPWSGDWELTLVAEGARLADERADLRAAMGDLRLAEWRQGAWLRPANLDPHRSPSARAVRDRQCVTFVGAGPVAGSAPVDCSRLFDCRRWSTVAGDLLGEMDRLAPLLDTGDDATPDGLAPAFETAAAVLRHLQADPLLPSELCPPDWPGERLRLHYDHFEARFQRCLRHWLRAAAAPS